ncbi:hypothetical protein UCMB321_5573 [Pseudomonas batumici]|uniref:Uncharacterized protein n=1 Tax=Pseudomonas batumici TaxID=226910 RepID=A0A0C2E4H6_9PSED|nr:hypothetical protein UCMB321_5573 [Pseudomonas batumici]
MDRRASLGPRPHLDFEQAMDGLRPWIIASAGIEPYQQLLALGGGQDRQLRQRQGRCLFQGLDQAFQGAEHIAAHPLRPGTGQGADVQGEVFAQIVHRQGQRIVGALFATEHFDAVPGRQVRAATRQVPIVQQCAEQRSRRRHAAATLRQGQRRMFVAEQGGKACVGGLDPFAHTQPAQRHPQRQGIDKHPQGAIGALAALQATEQDGAEHHFVLARDSTEHTGPGQVAKACGTDTQLPGLGPQAAAEAVVHGTAGLFDILAVALHILQAEGQGRLVDITEHLAEELLVLGLTHPQARLGHIVAVRDRDRQLHLAILHMRFDFRHQRPQGGGVVDQVMVLQQADPALIGRILPIVQAQHRRLADIQAGLGRVEAPAQLFGDIVGERVR